jgi:filamentous hemagglutinin family protein
LIALNRVLGLEGTIILGQLSANGKVFIINPNGVAFGNGSQINVGCLLASTQTYLMLILMVEIINSLEFPDQPL